LYLIKDDNVCEMGLRAGPAARESKEKDIAKNKGK
jgi:hypothetical protein